MEIGKRMDEIDALLKNFGAALSGFDPGVTAYFLSTDKNPKGLGYQGAGAFGEPLSFSRVAWQWLEPLLVELRQARANAAERQGDALAAALKASEERAEKAEQQIARWEKRCESTDERCRGSVLAQRIAEVAAAGDDAALHAECGGKMHETGREAALRVIEHLRKSVAGQQKRAEKAEHQRDALAAANLAANKRIAELEHEVDRLRGRGA